MKYSEMKDNFKEIWLVDFEFGSQPGERQDPVCLVALELKTNRTVKIWQDDLRKMVLPPYSIGKDSLFVAYFSSAEFGCHLSLKWPLPENVLDLFTEFRNFTNGLPLPCGNGLIGALTYFGIDGLDVSEKDTMRELALSGGPWNTSEQSALLEYCEGDVIGLKNLLEVMVPLIDKEHALLRGRYMKAVAQMEYCGIPVDAETLHNLREKWHEIEKGLISQVDRDYGVFEENTFKYAQFENYLTCKNIPWPQLESGRLNLSDDIFKEMARVYPDIYPLRQLRATLSQMRKFNLTAGSDGNNRCLLSPFQSKSGRNQPSSTKFIFGLSKWLRGLIKPKEGYALSYIDYEQQEFGIAAALSQDLRMQEAYLSGDPYLTFAKQAKAVPQNATKESHSQERELFKVCSLATQYGMGERTLAAMIKQPYAIARNLLRLHKETYPTFWKWSDSAVDYADLRREIKTVYGWTLHLGNGQTNPRSLRNFPMQANGAEMLRIACSYLIEEGIEVCAPVHDAILIQAPSGEIGEVTLRAQELMVKASAAVLSGFQLRTSFDTVTYPDRFMEPKGQEMWDQVMHILRSLLN